MGGKRAWVVAVRPGLAWPDQVEWGGGQVSQGGTRIAGRWPASLGFLLSLCVMGHEPQKGPRQGELGQATVPGFSGPHVLLPCPTTVSRRT